MDGMRAALGKLGVPSYGVLVNRQDFLALHTPFVLLQVDHYLVVDKVGERSVRVYDPRYGSERDLPLPPNDDKYTAAVLTTEIPTLNADLP